MPRLTVLIVLWMGALLAADASVAAADRVTADCSVVTGEGIQNSTVTVNCNIPPERVKELLDANTETLRTIYEPQVKELSGQLGVTQDALTSFFQILREQNVPLEKLPATLATIAQRFREMQERLAVLNPEDPATQALIEKARTALNAGHYDLADALLSQAEAAEQAAARQAEQLAHDAQAAADRRWLNAAAARAERGELSLTRLNYLEAAAHFQAATDMTPASDPTKRGIYRRRWADVLADYGEQQGDNTVLLQGIDLYHQALANLPRTRVPLDWALTQNNLGTVLSRLGERERSTVRLTEAVITYRAALEERTRDRVPQDWAMTQNNLGAALRMLGELEKSKTQLEEATAIYRATLEEVTRAWNPLIWAGIQNNFGNVLATMGKLEGDSGWLEEAAVAYQAALEERTRDRVPLDWAVTQTNLGAALQTLGVREDNTAQMKKAVAAYRAVLEELTRERNPLIWATTQNNLGNALAVLGELEGNSARLEEAVAAFRVALEEFTRKRAPRDWAQTQRNLTKTYRALKDKAKAEAICQELREANLGYQCD